MKTSTKPRRKASRPAKIAPQAALHGVRAVPGGIVLPAVPLWLLANYLTDRDDLSDLARGCPDDIGYDDATNMIRCRPASGAEFMDAAPLPAGMVVVWLCATEALHKLGPLATTPDVAAKLDAIERHCMSAFDAIGSTVVGKPLYPNAPTEL